MRIAAAPKKSVKGKDPISVELMRHLKELDERLTVVELDLGIVARPRLKLIKGDRRG